MTDTTPTFDVEEIWPDTADPVDHALAQLREPHHLLAEALLVVRRAQAMGVDIDSDNTTPHCREIWGDRHVRLLDEADSLARIAQVAAELATAERQATLHAVDGFLDERDAAPAPQDEPEAVQMRFTADIVGMPVGRVSGRAWVWLPGYGFIDVTDGSEFDVEGNPGYTLSGRVVSLTAEHAMVVLGSGVPACLSRELLTLEPDE